jgi:hypothetical protein
MRFDINRMCNLAGLGKNSRASGLLNESKYEEADHLDEMDHFSEMDHFDEGKDEEEKEEADSVEEDDDEMVEIDEVELVQELRRMKKIVTEARTKSKKIQKRKKISLQETQLKAIIDQEVQNVLKDLNLTTGWMYGNRKPTQSRSGFSHQGSMLKGIGFK